MTNKKQNCAKVMNPKGKILYFDFTEKNELDKYSNFYFHEKNRRQLQNDLNELEGQISRLDVTKRGLADENSRLCKSLDEKDKTIQVSL